MSLEDDALEYHAREPPGKLAISTTKPTNTQEDLSLAYSPGVAAPCRAIDTNPEDVFKYTAKGNLVAVVSDGSATLGLGDIGGLASKPVMEGKGVLFKRFADVDVYDIELDVEDPDAMVSVIESMEPTFGGINLEDIAAPECFTIEKALKESLSIPVFHDDQHGTAIISGAALLNALDIVEKDISDVEVVFSGAGSGAIATARFFETLGVESEHITMVDSDGVITDTRVQQGEVNQYKAEFAVDRSATTLADAMVDADVFVGLSVGGIVDREMVRSMAQDPIVFPMANPEPEIEYGDAREAGEGTVIVATGRSDYPNQVNNVLGFPFIFRGALDVRARDINEEMKVAAAKALRQLAHEDVPQDVLQAYGGDQIEFGPEYIIPKPLDPRVLFEVAPAVARAAIESDVARREVDFDTYVEDLEARIDY